MKPLARWTIGPASDRGYDILALAVKSFRRIYGETFDLIITHNNVNQAQMARLRKLDVPLFKQFHCQEMEYEPQSCKWKLYPPRLRPERHELVMDNDLILHRRLPALDEFLGREDQWIITEAYERCFGQYDRFIPEGLKCNVGFYGMPPGYDFAADIRRVQAEDNPRGWQTHFDDQGLITACFVRHNMVVVPRTEISVSLHEKLMPEGTHGVHFVGSNGGAKSHVGWDRYSKFRLKLI